MISLLMVVALGQVSATDGSEQQVRQTVERSLPFLAREGELWAEQRGCVSCHHVPFMIWAHNEALTRGMEVDRARIQAVTNWAFVNMLGERVESGGADTISQMLLGRDRSSPWRRKPPRHFKTVDPYETLFEILLERQAKDGSWPPEGQLTTPPEFTTGWALLALHSRGDVGGDPSAGLDPKRDLGDELANQLATIQRRIPEARIRALNYLDGVERHKTHQGLVLRAMLESTYGDGGNDTLRKEVLSLQRADGGWSSRLDLSESDALATGQTLYALSRLGGPGDQDAILRARRFLGRSQRADGSWDVPADRVRIGERRDSLDMVFSYWGTAWAAIGLLRTIPDSSTPSVHPTGSVGTPSAEIKSAR